MSRTVAGKVLLGIGATGVAVALLATVFGWRLLRDVEQPLEGSAGLTEQASEALGSSLDLAEEAAAILERGLAQTEATTRDVAGALGEAEAVVDATADISEDRIAESLDAVEQVMPTLVDAAGVIDRTLTSLSAVPLAPDYRPAEPFDESLRTLQEEMEGLSGDLRDQAAVLRRGGASLTEVREGAVAIADDMEELNATFGAAVGLLREYAGSAAEAARLVDDSRANLSRQAALGRVLVVVLGVTLLAAQTVPLGLGWLLLRPDTAAAFLARP